MTRNAMDSIFASDSDDELEFGNGRSSTKEKVVVEMTEREKEEAQGFMRAFPEVFGRLVGLAGDSQKRVEVFRGTSWERHVVHSLCSLMGLEHEPLRQPKGEFVVYVRRPEPFTCAFAPFPASLWEVDVLEEEVNPFQELCLDKSRLLRYLMNRYKELYFAVVQYKHGKDSSGSKNLFFSWTLDEKERFAVKCFGEHLHVTTQTLVSCDGNCLISLSSSNQLDSNVMNGRRIDWKDSEGNEWEYTLPAVLEEIYDTQTVCNASGQSVRVQAGVTTRAGSFLQWLITTKGLNKSLEIGFAFGISALYCCHMHSLLQRQGKHTAIDPFQSSAQDWDSVGLINIKNANLDKYFELIEEPSELALPFLQRAGRVFDLILIDGNHLFDHVFVDLFYCSRIVSENGFIVLDDADLPSVLKVIEFARHNFAHLEPFPPGCFDRTFTFIKVSSQDPRLWYSHAPF